MQPKRKIRLTSGQGMMCLIHSIFPNSVDQYGGVYCSDAEKRLNDIKQYVLNRIVQLKTIKTEQDFNNLQPPLTSDELAQLKECVPYGDDARNVRHPNEHSDNPQLHSILSTNGKQIFANMLDYAQREFTAINTGCNNVDNLCYYIASYYGISIDVHQDNGTGGYNTTSYGNGRRKYHIYGQPGHFSAMLADDEYNKLSKNSTPIWQPQINQPQFPKVPETYIVNLDITNLSSKKIPQINIKTMESFNDPNSKVEYTNIGRFYSETKPKPQKSDIKTAITNVFQQVAKKLDDDGKGKVKCFMEIMGAIIEEKEKKGGMVGVNKELSGENAGFSVWQKDFQTKLDKHNTTHSKAYPMKEMQKISVLFQKFSQDILNTAVGRHYENNGKEVQTGMRSYRAVQILSKIQSKSAQR